MPPSHLAPSALAPSRRYLCLEKREEIALLLAQNIGLREIARRLGRAASTISREIRRNAATRSGGFDYRATTAQWHAERSARRPKAAKLATNAALRQYVQDRLSGHIPHPGGSVVVGPQTAWKGRRHGRRQPRQWAASQSASSGRASPSGPATAVAVQSAFRIASSVLSAAAQKMSSMRSSESRTSGIVSPSD